MKIIIASGNPGKIIEIRSILSLYPSLKLELETIQDFNVPEPDEPYDSFMENARHKAKYYAGFTKTATLSEDAGLCIEALNGFPGVKTKDFLLECGSLDKSYAKLEQLLSNTTNYKAYFVCAAALYLPKEDRFITYQGSDNGTISFPARGNLGFGFDPIFIPEGYTETMAVLGPELKIKVGHRAIAIRGIAEQLSL